MTQKEETKPIKGFHTRKAERKKYYEDYVKYWREIPCLACNGSGYYDSNDNPPCGGCDGSGVEYQKVDIEKIKPYIGKHLKLRTSNETDLYVYVKDTRTVFYKYVDASPGGKLETKSRPGKLEFGYNPRNDKEEWFFADVYNRRRPDKDWLFFMSFFKEYDKPSPKE